MGDNQIRHLPVLDAAGQLVGLFSLDMIAEDVSEHLAGETLGEVVETR
jgi:CBS domain-containing protein